MLDRHSYAQTKMYRQKRRAEGKCAVCCKPSVKYRCPTCNEKRNKLWNAARRNLVDRCHHCLKPLPEHRLSMATCGWCQEVRPDKWGWYSGSSK